MKSEMERALGSLIAENDASTVPGTWVGCTICAYKIFVESGRNDYPVQLAHARLALYKHLQSNHRKAVISALEEEMIDLDQQG